VASKDIPHPPIELLVTTSEETGMDGAMALNPEDITGKPLINIDSEEEGILPVSSLTPFSFPDPRGTSLSSLINIDSEEEGILTVSCAGGCTALLSTLVRWEDVPKEKTALTIDIEGLLGGHSGLEINKGRANANKLLGRLLYKAGDKIRLASVDGGSKHNAIPRDAHAVVVVNPSEETVIRKLAGSLEMSLKDEYKTADPGIRITVKPAEKMPKQVMTRQCEKDVISLLYLLPDGVQSMSMEIPGLVESSLNIGVLRTKDNVVEMSTAIRSSVGSVKQDIYNRIEAAAALTNTSVTAEGEYPEWQYDPDSKLREVCIEQYELLFGHKPEVAALHAGLECALFAEKFKGRLDMMSIGPTMIGVHTAEEHLSIASTLRTWHYLLAVLRALK